MGRTDGQEHGGIIQMDTETQAAPRHALYQHADTTCSAYSELDCGSDQFRLVRILPGVQTEDIHCETATYTAAEAPPYTALSYTWGKFAANLNIVLNGRTKSVRKNLLRFLQMARQADKFKDQRFWIDFLCIDQANPIERNNQVSMMARIFGSARQVLVWLGPSYEESESAMEALGRKPSYWRKQGHITKVWSKPVGSAIRRLCQRAYWTRLWMVQELPQAESIYLTCGDTEIPWTRFESFVSSMEQEDDTSRRLHGFEFELNLASPAIVMAKRIRGRPIKRSLFQKILETRDLGCKEQRDRAYALLSIVEEGHTGIRPDYQIPVRDLLLAVLRNEHILRTPANLEVVQTQYCDLARAIGVEQASILLFDEPQEEPSQSEREEGIHIALRKHPTGMTIWWAKAFALDEVKRLLHLEHVAEEVTRWLSGNHVPLHRKTWAASILKVALRKLSPNMLACVVANASTSHVQLGMKQASALELQQEGLNTEEQRHELLLSHIMGRIGLDVLAIDELQLLVIMALRSNTPRIGRLLLQSHDLDVKIGCQVDNDGQGKSVSITKQVIVSGSTSIIRFLLQHTPAKFKFNAEEPECRKLLFRAVKYDRHEILRLLLHVQGVDVNASTGNGMTPLHCAALKSSSKSVELLLGADGIDVNAKNDLGETPLHIAAKHNCAAVTEILIRAQGIDMDAKTHKGFTLLHSAADSGSLRIAALLLQHTNIDVDAEDDYGRTALIIAAAVVISGAMIELLLQQGNASINKADRYGQTPLHRAVQSGAVCNVQALLQSSTVDINLKEHCDFSAFDLTSPAFRSIGPMDEKERWDNMQVMLIDTGKVLPDSLSSGTMYTMPLDRREKLAAQWTRKGLSFLEDFWSSAPNAVLRQDPWSYFNWEIQT